jgi:putative hydrolase of HD superfamily
MDKLTKQINFLTEIDKLKSIFRQSLLADGSRHEDDAEHSWHLCMYAIVLEEYAKPGTDMLHVIKMLLVHDLVEIYAGDTYLYDVEGNKTKAERERKAADKLYALLDLNGQGGELKALWDEFEACESDESKFANGLDRLQPIMLNYLTCGEMWLKNKVHKKDVLDRGYRLVNYGHPDLVAFLNKILDDSVEKGYLLP